MSTQTHDKGAGAHGFIGTSRATREDVRGALYSSIGTLRLEAEDTMKRLEPYLSRVEPIEEVSLPRLREAYIVAARIASKHLTGEDLAKLYTLDQAANAEIVNQGLERRLLDLGKFVNLWVTFGTALAAESAPEIAEEGAYREAEAILFAEEDRHARLAALPRGMSCGELLATDFPPPAWIVPGLLVSGLSILAGAPKLGKSWLALAIGSAVGSGGAVLGRYRVERRRALYLALEDTPRRLKNRLEKIGASSDSWLDLFTQWRSGTEGIADLDAYLEEHLDIKLVLIDTLARFRGAPSGDDRYAADYAAASSIKTVADRHDCAIVVIHHVRKMASEDIMDTVSGTNGLNGAADSTWVLTRTRGEADASLFITGRDVEEQTLALRFDSDCGSWAVLGDAAEYAQSRERREALDAVPLEPASRKTKDIVARLEKKPAAVSRLLEKLEAEGLVYSPNYGEWSRRGGKSGKSVNVQETVNEPEQGTFTLLPDLPADIPSSEHVAGLSLEGLARLEEIKKANEARRKAEVANWTEEEGKAYLAQAQALLDNHIALEQLKTETPALEAEPLPRPAAVAAPAPDATWPKPGRRKRGGEAVGVEWENLGAVPAGGDE